MEKHVRQQMFRLSDIQRQEMESLLSVKGPDKEVNSMQVVSLDNLFFNNELQYRNLSDFRTLEMDCNFCKMA